MISMMVSQSVGWRPSQIANVKYWLSAKVMGSLWQLSTFATPVTADTDPVGGWKDQSGQGNNVIQATAGFRPLWYSGAGYPYIMGDGVDDFLRKATTPSLAQVNTVFIVVSQMSSTGVSQQIVDGGAGTTNRNQIIITTVGNLRIAANTSLTSAVFVDAAFHTLEAVFNGASSALYEESTQIITPQQAGAGALDGITLLATRTGISNAVCRVHEVIVVNGTVSAPDTALMLNYLKGQWAIPGN